MKKPTQQEVILGLLIKNTSVSNYDLHNIQPPIFQVGTRIFELREKGYDIRTTWDSKDKKKCYYTIYPGGLKLDGVMIENTESIPDDLFVYSKEGLGI